MQRLRTVLLVLAGIAMGLGGAIFVYDNDDLLALNFLRWQMEPMPVWAVVALAMIAGAVAPRLLGLGAAWRRFRDGRKLRSRLVELEAEVVRLRNLPLEALPEETRQVERRAGATVVASTRAGLQPPLERPRLLDRAEPPDAYAAFLADGVGFDEVEAETWQSDAGRRTLAPPPDDLDPYAIAFDAQEPAMEDLEDADLYPSVGDSGQRSGSRR